MNLKNEVVKTLAITIATLVSLLFSSIMVMALLNSCIIKASFIQSCALVLLVKVLQLPILPKKS